MLELAKTAYYILRLLAHLLTFVSSCLFETGRIELAMKANIGGNPKPL